MTLTLKLSGSLDLEPLDPCNSESLKQSKDNHLQMFFKTLNLKNFSKFTEKHLCCSLFLIKLQAFKPATSLKRDSDTDVSCGYCKIFKYSFFIEHLRWLLLIVQPQYRYNKVSWGVYCAFDFDQNLKQYIAKIIPYYNIVFTPLPFPLEGRIEIFKMDGGGWQDLNFQMVVVGKEGVTFFRGVAIFK